MAGHGFGMWGHVGMPCLALNPHMWIQQSILQINDLLNLFKAHLSCDRNLFFHLKRAKDVKINLT